MVNNFAALKYWSKGNFKLFDEGILDKNKNLKILGRVDDVINIRGHRIGSAEIESTVLKIKLVNEVCAIAINDKIEGHKIVLFVNGDKKSKNEINQIIRNNFGTFALPKKIYFLNELPKTRSGKILRRFLRDLLNKPQDKIGDLSTMLNKKVIKEILNEIKK